MKSRNKIRAVIISIGAALWVALFVFQFCIRPFTAAATSVNIITPFSNWFLGYYGSDGRYYENDTYQGYYFRTSPRYAVVTDAVYTVQFTGNLDGYRCYINEFDVNGNFIQRVSNTSPTFTYRPGATIGSISLTLRNYYVTGVECTMMYDSTLPVMPQGEERIYDEIHYGSDGDFYVVGNEKALIYYKYPPDADLKYIKIMAVNNYGQRLKFRVVGYVHGSEVFRSGLANYGESIDIQNRNFDYYNVYLVNEDSDGESIPTEYIQSFKYIYGIRYYEQIPTEPPGISEDITATDYIDLNGLDWYIPTAPAPDSSARGALELIASVNNRLFSAFPIYITAAGVAFLCWLLWLSARRND